MRSCNFGCSVLHPRNAILLFPANGAKNHDSIYGRQMATMCSPTSCYHHKHASHKKLTLYSWSWIESSNGKQQRRHSYFFLLHPKCQNLLQPDRPFCNIITSKQEDWLILSIPETSCELQNFESVGRDQH